MYILNSLESLDRNDENHIVINGDNLDVLKSLRFTHKGKFQAILIDPPYGTGNDGFKFNDRYARTEFSAMIRPVLALAYELLSDTGFIAVNFDNGQFRLVTEEALRDIFGYKNQIATLVWPTKQPSPNARNFWVQDEPIFLYAKDKNKFKSNLYPSKYIELDEEKEKKKYNQEDEFGQFKTQPIRDWNTRTSSYREGSPSRWFPMVQRSIPLTTRVWRRRGVGHSSCTRKIKKLSYGRKTKMVSGRLTRSCTAQRFQRRLGTPSLTLL